MKLKNLIPLRYRTKFVRQFGEAKLVKLPNGQHELIGGTDLTRLDFSGPFAFHRLVLSSAQTNTSHGPES